MVNVLFVDDDLETARSYAELVRAATKLRTLAVSRKGEALEAAKKFPISVVVLDQKMPEISGTELYNELEKQIPGIRAIMLSGEASNMDFEDAINFGYNKYLHKSRFRELPNIVLDQFRKYYAQSLENFEKEIRLSKVKRYFGLGGAVEFWLVKTVVEDEFYIPPESWKLSERINRGESKTVKQIFETSKELKFEENWEAGISANIELAIKAAHEIKTKVTSDFKAKETFSSIQKNIRRFETETKIELSDDPVSTEKPYVRSRSFYWAPVFQKTNYYMYRKIIPFEEKIPFSITILHPAKYFATKQIDYLSNEEKNEIYTGMHPFDD